MLEFLQLTKRYSRWGTPAVDDLSFPVRNGEVVGFIGLNGAGKSTSIRVATGILLPTSGSVAVDGHDIVREKVDASAQVGWVPESPAYPASARALALLRYYAAYHGIDGSTADRRGAELLRQVGLEGTERRPLGSFSLGMKKRFAIAASQITDPQNLLLDEVLNGLDPAGLAFTRTWLAELRRSGRAVLLSSHNLEELGNLADRVALLHSGRLLKVVDREEVERLGQRSVLVTFVPVDDHALEILRKFGTPSVLRPNLVAVRELRGEPADLVSALVAAQYRVAEVRSEQPALEEYFLRLLKTAG